MRRRRFVLGALSMGYGKAVAAFGQLLLVPVLANAWGVALYGQWLIDRPPLSGPFGLLVHDRLLRHGWP